MNLFSELSLTIILAAVITGIFRALKQPLIIGYVVTGLLLGSVFSSSVHAGEILSIFGQMGIAILLFIVGLHLSPSQIKSFGKPVLAVGFLQVLLTAFLGYFAALLFGLTQAESLYVGIALSFSSTIIVLKYLSDKNDLEMLYGRISVGILLLQDLVACVVLIFVSALSEGTDGMSGFSLLLVKSILLTYITFTVSARYLPKLGSFFAASQEYLFLFSLAWGFGLAVVYSYFGLSLEIGALVAGVSLSVTPYSQEISARLKPLRDFFIIMFFITVGSEAAASSTSGLLPGIAFFTLFTLVIKPVLLMVLTGSAGYNKKTGFFTGMSLSQISEFSLILLFLGWEKGQVSRGVVSMITVSGLISMAVSSYLMAYLDKLYPKVSRYLSLFEKKKPISESSIVSNYDIVLFGCNRVGFDFINLFMGSGSGFLCVDFDPYVIQNLKKRGVNCMYGDAYDLELLEEIRAKSASIVVSTIPDYETNVFLLEHIRKHNHKSKVIVLCYNIDEALKLYDLGASYVILPHFITGEFSAKIAASPGSLKKKKSDHISYLKHRKSLGHTHPRWGGK